MNSLRKNVKGLLFSQLSMLRWDPFGEPDAGIPSDCDPRVEKQSLLLPFLLFSGAQLGMGNFHGLWVVGGTQQSNCCLMGLVVMNEIIEVNRKVNE